MKTLVKNGQKRNFNDKAARIAMEHLGWTELIVPEKPPEVGTKTSRLQPPIIQPPVKLVQPEIIPEPTKVLKEPAKPKRRAKK